MREGTTITKASDGDGYVVRGRHWHRGENAVIGYVAKRAGGWVAVVRGERRQDGSIPYTSQACDGGTIVARDPQTVLDDDRCESHRTRKIAVSEVEDQSL